MWSPWNMMLFMLGVLFAVLIGCQSEEKRVTELPFPNRTELFNRVVTCNNPLHSDMVYESKTFACKDMRIDGHRLRYWYRVPDHSCTDAGDDFDAGADAVENDVAGLCRALLTANKIDGQLRAAFIHDPSCGYSGIERMRLARSASSPDGHEWHLLHPGRGFMKTLRCMLLQS